MWLRRRASRSGCAWAWRVVLQVVNRVAPPEAAGRAGDVLALLAVAGVTYMVVWMKRHSRELKGSLEASAEEALLLGLVVGPRGHGVLRGPAGRARDGGLPAGGLRQLQGPGRHRDGRRARHRRRPSAWGSRSTAAASGSTCPASSGSRASCWCSWPPVCWRARSTPRTRPGGSTSCSRRRSISGGWSRPGSVRAALLTGMLGLQPVPTVGETLAWLLYAVPMGLYVLWPARPPVQTERPAPAPVTVAS